MRNIVAVIMAGVLGIYGLITAVVLSNQISGLQPNFGTMEGDTAIRPFGVYTAFDGFRHLAAGLTCGLSGLAAGMAIGIVGDSGVRAVGQQPALFVPSVLILIFSEALALYGLIIALILGIKSPAKVCMKE
jgi:V-type H+-transporting ATPase 16kDa proteolipid subunit